MTKTSSFTNKEIYDLVDKLRDENNIRFDNLEKKIDSNYLTRAEADLRFKAVSDKYDPTQRQVNIIGGTVILAVVAAILKLVIH